MRFVLFSTVAALVIFFPSSSVVWIWATFLLALLAAAAAYTGLHFMAQVLRNVSAELKRYTEKKGTEQETPEMYRDQSQETQKDPQQDGPHPP